MAAKKTSAGKKLGVYRAKRSADRTWSGARAEELRKELERLGAPRTPVKPGAVTLMLAETRDEAFTNPEWRADADPRFGIGRAVPAGDARQGQGSALSGRQLSRLWTFLAHPGLVTTGSSARSGPASDPDDPTASVGRGRKTQPPRAPGRATAPSLLFPNVSWITRPKPPARPLHQ